VQPQTMPQSPFPIQHAFVVQCAAETPLDAPGLIGRVEHLVSGQATRFVSAEALLAFMVERLQDVRQPPGAAEAEKDV
jgi:hypothetical protein